MQEGFELFRSAHQYELKHLSALRAMASIGAMLWRRQVIVEQGCDSKSDMEDDAAEGPQNETSSQRAEWPLIDVADIIEDVLMHAAHMLRCARWFHLLSDSCLAWASADAPKVMRHLLVFEKGGVVDRQGPCSGWKLPDTSAGGRPRRNRRNNVDLAAYDRMRVVTTELRRLVCEGRTIELRLSPRIRLANRELTRALQWV